MTKGVVFDIEEFGVYDGPGIRSVIFLKGCPLRCRWCHNPEGLVRVPQRLKSAHLCAGCGACDAVCAHPDHCDACGACVKVCPRGALRIAGRMMASEEVARCIAKNAEALRMSGGGVTFSGGEALMQPEFVVEIRRLLPGLHAVIETSGYAAPDVFEGVISEMDMVLMDIKLVDPAAHKRWTGVDNAPILANFERLKSMGVPFRARVPLIPGVTDTEANLTAAARLLAGAKNLDRVELMRYNRAAGAKYAQVGMEYDPGFCEDQAPNAWAKPFTDRNMEVITL